MGGVRAVIESDSEPVQDRAQELGWQTGNSDPFDFAELWLSSNDPVARARLHRIRSETVLLYGGAVLAGLYTTYLAMRTSMGSAWIALAIVAAGLAVTGFLHQIDGRNAILLYLHGAHGRISGEKK